jgi:hypothetical protein
MNEIIVKWNQIYTKGNTLSNTIKINTLLFADDQVTIADSEDTLQREVFTITKHSKIFCKGNINRKT